MRAVDATVLVPLVTHDDRKQVAAAESFVSKGAWASTLGLMKATWVLTAVSELTHAEIATAVGMLCFIGISPFKSPIAWPQHSSSSAPARRRGSPIV